jgi:ATP-dependent helicase/nuclease subunit A
VSGPPLEPPALRPTPSRPEPAGGGPSLRWSQWNAVRSLDGHVLVTAGAGTGKTFTVVSAFLYLLGVPIRTPDGTAAAERPLDLHEIAAITFTNQAASELKRSLRAALRGHGRPDLARRVDAARVGTIHRFCGDVLREFALRTGRDPSLRVLEEGEAAALARTAARESLIDAVESSAAEAKRLLERRSVREVEGWIAALLDQSDVLKALSGSTRLDDDARDLVQLARRASQRLDGTLDDMGAVDFDRMIVWTRDLLRDDPRALRTLRRRVRVLIIDEFQDVDPAQKDIAYLLGGLEARTWSPPEHAPRAPHGEVGRRSDAPRPPPPIPDNVTRLFLVGDPKQSIYRFRRADVTVWTRVERELAAGRGAVVPLDESFRASPELLGWVDATSGVQLDRPLDGVAHADFEVPYRALAATRPASGDAAVELLILPPARDGKRLQNDVSRRAEGAWIAHRARALHDAGTPWREMALLVPAWTNVGHYEDVLAEARIPAYTIRGEGFLERREIVDLITALQAIRSPRDDRALFGFLRGPFVGVRDDTLLRVARHAGRPYWAALARLARGAEEGGDGGPATLGALAGGADEEALLRQGVALIDRLGGLRDRVPVAELLQRLIDRTGYLAHLALAGQPGLEAIANLRHFLGMARASADRSVGDFLADLAERRERERDRVSREIPARLYAEDDDVVTITTIHGAKGLEWDVVFCADIARAWRGEPEAFLRVDDTLLLGDPDVPAKDRPEPWPSVAERLKAEDRAERKRQWYVAQTRARDRLLLASLPLGQKPSSGSFARELTDTFPVLGAALDGTVPPDGAALPYQSATGASHEARIAVLSIDEAEAAAPATSSGPRGRDAAIVGAPLTTGDGADAVLAGPPPPVAAPAGPQRLSATQLLTRSRCEQRYHLKYVLRIPEPEAERHADSDTLIRAVVRGQIVHEVLHRYRDPEELTDVIEVAIGRWDEGAPPPDTERGARYRDELREEVDRVLALPEYTALRSAAGARRELRFLHVHPDGRATEGAIDLAVGPTGPSEGWRLVDVKTNRVDRAGAAAVAAGYAPQRDVYVDATGSISGESVEAFTFAFSGPGVAVSEPPPPGASARTAAMRDAIARGTPPALAADPAECVFCGYRVVGLCPGVAQGVPAPPGAPVAPGAETPPPPPPAPSETSPPPAAPSTFDAAPTEPPTAPPTAPAAPPPSDPAPTAPVAPPKPDRRAAGGDQLGLFE